MQKIFENKRFHLWISGVLILVVFLVYSNTFNASFHFDDTPHIVENYQIRNLGNIPEILKGQRGVTMATFALNYAASRQTCSPSFYVVRLDRLLDWPEYRIEFFLTLGSL